MIENIIVRELWVEARGSQNWVTTSLTVYVGSDPFSAPKITYETNLSRVAGGGAASASIEGFRYYDPRGNEFGQGTTVGETDADFLKRQSAGVLGHAISVTFELGARDMFAACTCTVFIHQRNLLNEILTAPINIFGSVFGP